jgi:hypothetical protein
MQLHQSIFLLLLVQTCETPTKPPNRIKVVGGLLIVGKYVGYTCKDGFEKADGDENRACLRDGTLTGKPLVCLSKYNNNIECP